MASEQLAQYVSMQRQSGFSDERIKQALLASNYSPSEIDAAFKSLQGMQDPAHMNATTHAQQGMSATQSYAALKEQGFDEKIARNAVQDVYGRHSLTHSHKGTLSFIVIALAISAFVLYLMLRPATAIPPDPPTTSEQLSTVIAIARDQGAAAALTECDLRFRNDDRDLCYLDIVIATMDKAPDDTVCNRIVDVEKRDTCLMQFLETNKLQSACSRMQLAENKAMCDKLVALQS